MDSDQTKIYFAILIAAGVLGVIVIYFIITIVRNQRRHLQMQQANLLVEIKTLENERKRIVSDLHDELGPLLSVVKFQITSLDIRDEEDRQLVDKATDHIDNVLHRIRDICNELMPQVLVRKGLVMAIQEFIHELDGKVPFRLTFEHDQTLEFDREQEIHLYRIIQEAVNNAIRHSEATSLSLKLEKKAGNLVITVADNGKGFESEKLQQESRGLGLKNILSRVNILKGDLYLASRPGKGTVYTIEIPGPEVYGSQHTNHHSGRS